MLPGAKCHFHSAKSEKLQTWDSSGLSLGPARLPAPAGFWSLCPKAAPLPLGQRVVGEGRVGPPPAPQEGMSGKNSSQSALTGMISLGLMALGSCLEREVGDLGIQIAAPLSWETLSGK